MDRILINDLLVRCVIGVRDEERRDKQDVLINVALVTDLRKAGASDRLEDSVDYRGLNKQILSMAEHSQFRLVEAMAQAVADICLAILQCRKSWSGLKSPVRSGSRGAPVLRSSESAPADHGAGIHQHRFEHRTGDQCEERHPPTRVTGADHGDLNSLSH